MPPLIQLPRTKLSKNFAQFLLRSSGKSGRVFFFLFFPFFLLRRGGNTGELCQSCQRRDANAVLRPTTANCGIADLWRWRKIGNSSIERSTNGCLSLTRVQCSFARSNLWNSRAIPRQFLSIVVASGSFSLSVTSLASSLLFSSAAFVPLRSFFPRCVFFSEFRQFQKSLSNSVRAELQKTIDPRATLTYQDCDTRAISLFDNFFYTIPARSASKFFDFHHFALTFGNSKPKVLPFSCLSPIFSNSLTLHCDVLWMTFTIRKKKKFLLRQFQIAILPKKKKKKEILDFVRYIFSLDVP